MKVDEELVVKASECDKDAFSVLYYSCYKDFYNFALYTIGNADDAADVVSDVFADIWKGIGKLRNPKAFASWAFKILSIRCKREISDILKHRSEYNLDDFSETPLLASENMETDIYERVSLSAALSKLDSEERMIVVLSALHGYTHREIAEMTGKSERAVSSKLYRAYSKLKKLMMR